MRSRLCRDADFLAFFEYCFISFPGLSRYNFKNNLRSCLVNSLVLQVKLVNVLSACHELDSVGQGASFEYIFLDLRFCYL